MVSGHSSNLVVKFRGAPCACKAGRSGDFPPSEPYDILRKSPIWQAICTLLRALGTRNDLLFVDLRTGRWPLVVEDHTDAVEELKVMTNAYQAEYGRNSRGVVNAVTKSGTRVLSTTLRFEW